MPEHQHVTHLRLVNGDEVVGELSGITNTEILIKKPMLVSEVTDERTKMSTIVLSKYVLFDENQDIHFSKSHVITKTHILDEIKVYYYNSIQYNTKFVEPVVKQELSKVNHVMENLLRQAAFEPILVRRPSKMSETYFDDEREDDGGRILVPGSNTLH